MKGWKWEGAKWVKAKKRKPKKARSKQPKSNLHHYNFSLKVPAAQELKLAPAHKHLIKLRGEATMSSGENRIAEYLGRNDIQFLTEYYFDDLCVNGKFKILFFDFYIPDYNIAIEYDGKQHYTEIYRGVKQVNVKKNDFIKNQYCQRNGIKLLRIKYTNKKNIEDIICAFFDKHF